MLATRLYQNNARPHFDAMAMRKSAVGARLVYGGHVISVCHALAYDGLENVVGILAVNGGSHVAPTRAGDTLYAYSEVLEKWKLPGRTDVAALRLRLVGLKNTPPPEVESAKVDLDGKSRYHPGVVLDLDYTVLMPRKQADRPATERGRGERKVGSAVKSEGTKRANRALRARRHRLRLTRTRPVPTP